MATRAEERAAYDRLLQVRRYLDTARTTPVEGRITLTLRYEVLHGRMSARIDPIQLLQDLDALSRSAPSEECRLDQYLDRVPLEFGGFRAGDTVLPEDATEGQSAGVVVSLQSPAVLTGGDACVEVRWPNGKQFWYSPSMLCHARGA